jgi:hypothetical protein
MEKDEELLNESLSAMLVFRTMLIKTGLSMGATRADEIIKKLVDRLDPKGDFENPPMYNNNLKP